MTVTRRPDILVLINCYIHVYRYICVCISRVAVVASRKSHDDRVAEVLLNAMKI